MKVSNLALALLAAALLPTFAHAGGNTDAVRDSFDRALGSNSDAKYLKKEPDPILASFERGFNSEPLASQTEPVAGEMGLLEVVNIVSVGKEADQVSASFWRDLNRGITVCEYFNSAQSDRTFAC